MANIIFSNKAYIDTTGLLTDKRIKISYIVFTPNAVHDTLVLRDVPSNGSKLKIQADTAKQTVVINFSDSPVLFSAGITVETLTSGATATLILTEG